nr:hypothetical protein [Tanacetum cinerariifolium]
MRVRLEHECDTIDRKQQRKGFKDNKKEKKGNDYWGPGDGPGSLFSKTVRHSSIYNMYDIKGLHLLPQPHDHILSRHCRLTTQMNVHFTLYLLNSSLHLQLAHYLHHL